jgi:hypothetical protein
MVVRARGVRANGLEFGLLEAGSGPLAPTAVADDGRYGIGALVADAVALHQALDGDGDAVLIGTGAPRRPTARRRSLRSDGGGW